MQPDTNLQARKAEAFDLMMESMGKRGIPAERPGQPMGRPIENIDLIQLALALKRRLVFIVIAALLGGLGAYFYTENYITPLYQASIKMIVNAKENETGVVKSASELTSGESLVATYATVIKSNRVMEETVRKLGLTMSWRTLNSMVAVQPVANTPVINLIVTSADPEFCRQVVTTISQIAPELIVEAVQAGSCNVITDADCTGVPISPNVRSNVMKGLVFGGAACAGLVALLYLLNDKISSEEQMAQLSDIPILSTIPMADAGTGKRGRAYGRSGRKSKRSGREPTHEEKHD